MFTRSGHSRVRQLAITLAATASILADAAAGAEMSPNDALVQAAGWGEIARVEALLKSGANANYEIKPGLSALTEAIRKGHVEVVRALLDANVDANGGAGMKGSPLQVAGYSRKLDLVPLLLEAGADPNVVDVSGATPLFYAVQEGRVDIVRTLLAAGADPSPRVTWGGGRSALVWTLMSGNLEMAMVLVKAGANGNAATDYQETPLRIASRGSSPAHLELVRALLALGVDVEAGQVPSYKLGGICTVRGGPCGVVRPLIRTAEGTALGIAADTGSVEIVRALLDAGAEVDAKQPGWRTPLMIAAMAGRADVVRMLLDAGADRDARDSEQRTALMFATLLPANEHDSQEVTDILNAARTATSDTNQ